MRACCSPRCPTPMTAVLNVTVYCFSVLIYFMTDRRQYAESRRQLTVQRSAYCLCSLPTCSEGTILATFNPCQAPLASSLLRHCRLLSLGFGFTPSGRTRRAAL